MKRTIAVALAVRDWTRGACSSASVGSRSGDIRPRPRREIEHGGFVQVGRVGDWLFALEQEPQQERTLREGLVPLLRRASAGGESAGVSVWDYDEHRIAEFGRAVTPVILTV